MSSLNKGASLQNGKYIIGTTLGQGGFGITYEAEQVSLGRKVAVKEFFMKDSCERDESTSHVTVPTASNRELVSKFRDKFLREARMIAALDHEHIVKIHDVFEENGTAYYVMEYLGGGSLDRKIKANDAMTESEALGFIRQIGDALSYLHSQNILHFDIKPANVLLGKNGSAKLIDFGISKHYDDAGVQTSSTPVGISKGYAPLEQYQQGSDIKSFTPATDIYSLGATLYALLSGSNPPEASIVNEDGVSVIDGVSPAVMHTIEKAMQPRRKDRPQSVAEFIALLDGTAKEDDSEETVIPVSAAKELKLEKAGTLAQMPVKPQKFEEKKSKGFPKWLYGLIAGVAVVVLATVLLKRPDKPDTQDVLQTDSTVVVPEAKPEKLVTSKPFSSASKPEPPAKPDSPTVIELKSISLSETTLELEKGSSATLTVKYNPSNATDKTTTWKSSNSSVAKVNSNGKVTALTVGSATISANCQGKDSYCDVIVKANEIQPSKPESPVQQTLTTSTSAVDQSTQSAPATTGNHNGHDWVDLGLSVKWATYNVGATSPENCGWSFAWGETRLKLSCNWSNLKYCLDGNGDSFYKYNPFLDGKKDHRIVLELSDDAASQNWFGCWRMPTKQEFQELIDKCTWTWSSINGKKGYKVVSKTNGNSIFLPATSVDETISQGCYWSSSLYVSNARTANCLYFHYYSVTNITPRYGHHMTQKERCDLQFVRPVCQ